MLHDEALWAQTVTTVAADLPSSPILIQSWQRSRSAGVERDGTPDFRRVSANELQERHSTNRDLLAVTIPHLRWLSHWFRQRPHVVYLVDADGIVLHAEGDPDAVELYRLSPGFDWSEGVMGTNGAGTALVSGLPVAVIGCDHWSAAWKNATCLGAPILGTDGRAVGAIDVSMDIQEGDRERLVVVAHVAYTITQELARRQLEAENRSKDDRYEEARTVLARQSHVERALRESQVRLQTIIDSTSAVIYVVDDQNRFELANRQFCELFGVSADGVIGRSIYDVFPTDAADQFAAHNREVLQAGTSREFEEVVPQQNDLHTYISIKSPLPNSDGVPCAISGVSTDITERKRLIDALERAQRHKDVVIATIAHELRQPLGAIRAALAVMAARVSREQGERGRAIVERQVDQLARLVDDLLDASRIAQGKIVLRRSRIIINEVIHDSLELVQPSIRDRDQTLRLDMPDDPIWIEADVERLQQVFSNLLANAVKFTERGGCVFVLVEAHARDVTVRVRDTGKGIATEILPHVFELFAQASPDDGGLGIGLAVVRGLVQAHGGTVEARSDGLGEGSEFIVSLPLAPESE